MIEMRDYSLDLGEFALKNVNVEIKNGEIFSVIGVTGSGKSVLLEALAGLHPEHSGIVLYDGKNIDEVGVGDRRIGFVYQDYSLFPHMTVYENIEFGLKMHKMERSQRENMINNMMDELHISHLAHRYPQTLSGGEKQRVALARALVLAPEVLFMDEPFSALDPNTRKDMYALMRRIHDKFKCTIVFVTHNFDEAQELADRIAIMIDGELRAVCKADELFQNHEDKEVREFLGGRGNGESRVL